MNKDIIIIVLSLILFTLLWVGWEMFEKVRTEKVEGSSMFCTADGRECADGLYIGRTSSDCAFAPCPGN